LFINQDKFPIFLKILLNSVGIN